MYCNAFMWFKAKKTHYFPHTVHYCCSSMPRPFWNASIFTKLRIEACSYWPAIQCVIGRIPQAWDGNVAPLTVLWCCFPARRHKNNKTHYKRGICSSGRYIITDYNDLYCLFTRRIVSRCVNINLSAFVIGETTNNKHYSTLLKTRVWIVSSKFFKWENVLTRCESEASDCPCKVGIAPLYRNSLYAYLAVYSQVQETVCKHCNI